MSSHRSLAANLSFPARGSSAASIRITSKPCFHGEDDAAGGGGEPSAKNSKVEEDESAKTTRMKIAHKLLLDQFSAVEADFDNGLFTIKCEQTREQEEVVCMASLEFAEDGGGVKINVECADEQQGALVRDCLLQLGRATAPFSLKP